MKISRRSVLHVSGLAAAALALTGCSAAGSAALGGKLPGLLKSLLGKKGRLPLRPRPKLPATWPPPRRPRANSRTRPLRLARVRRRHPHRRRAQHQQPPGGCDGEQHRQLPAPECPPQRGIGSADLLIEAKVEGGITRLCAVFSDADSIPEVGPIRSGRDQFLQLLMPWNILYYHDGESIFCTQFVNVYGYPG